MPQWHQGWIEPVKSMVMGFHLPDQFRGPFPSLFHLPSVPEGEGLCQGLVER